MIGVCQAKWGIVEKESTVCVKEAVDEFYWRKVMGGGAGQHIAFFKTRKIQYGNA